MTTPNSWSERDMLTLAEEIGLAGATLATRIRKTFSRMDEAEQIRLLDQMREEASRRHLVYLRDGAMDVIRVLPTPLAAQPDQLAYIHYVTLTVQNALKRLPELYFQDFSVRAVLQLPAAEEEWLWRCWSPSHRENNPIFGRLDALIDYTSPTWKNSLKFVEPNMSGIGGLHLVPTAERIVVDCVLPVLRRSDPEVRLERAPDIRELLMQEILDHLEVLGRATRNVCFVEPKYAGSGPDEQEELARYFQDHHGMKLMHADPLELRRQGNEVYYKDDVVDLVYRDYSVADLLFLQSEGADIEPMRLLFQQNRMISSIAAELDQKSCWEILTDSQFTQKYFSAEERQIFRRHILWTRILSDRSTSLPDGEIGSLLEHVREERETLVLKPNRAYGGEGITIGPAVTQSEWESAVNEALADPDRWVVQQLANIPIGEFPVVGPDGHVHDEPFHVVMGFAPTKYGVAILGRASQKQVVNVAQRGGMCVVLIGRPPAPPHGPV